MPLLISFLPCGFPCSLWTSVFDTGLATVLDAFQTANELADLSGLSSSRFDVSVVGVRKHVKTSLGFTVPVRPVGKRVPDCVVVPAIGFKMPDALQRALARPTSATRPRCFSSGPHVERP